MNRLISVEQSLVHSNYFPSGLEMELKGLLKSMAMMNQNGERHRVLTLRESMSKCDTHESQIVYSFACRLLDITQC